MTHDHRDRNADDWDQLDGDTVRGRIFSDVLDTARSRRRQGLEQQVRAVLAVGQVARFAQHQSNHLGLARRQLDLARREADHLVRKQASLAFGDRHETAVFGHVLADERDAELTGFAAPVDQRDLRGAVALLEHDARWRHHQISRSLHTSGYVAQRYHAGKPHNDAF